MQIIKTNEHIKYFCPMKYTSIPNHMNICEGSKCMWWTYKLVPSENTTTYSLLEDKDLGYCGK